ncbi:MAG: NAD(P)/FAD-dependent oxidoreductase [Flavitalea sp.]
MKLLVIGGGAAGFFCAVNAARLAPSLDVVLVEKSSKLLSKVRVSGGGRCNLTHACFDINEMSKRYPRGTNFVKKSFHRFFTTDTIEWFKIRGVESKQEEDGRMFPVSDSSQSVIDCLLRDANKYRIEILMNREVRALDKVGDQWNVEFGNGDKMDADYVCIACGGFPKASMFSWITDLGHSIEEPVPSLFTFNMPGNSITSLMGVSVNDAVVKVSGTKLQESGPVLITHWGLSGPAILKLSAWGARELKDKNYEFRVIINWLPEFHENSIRDKLLDIKETNRLQFIQSRNYIGLPQRLWQYFCLKAEISEQLKWADLPSVKLNKLCKILCADEMQVHGKTTFKEEFVTAGGIKLNEVNVQTMESKIKPGLFFAGEILDVDGITGGYNFQHAWTSGFIAAKTIAERVV